MTFSTILTCHVRNPRAVELVLQAMRTHQATCESYLTILDHDAAEPSNNRRLLEECDKLGACYKYTHEVYHQTKWWNDFRRHAVTDYVIFSSADVIYHAGWLDEIKRGIVQHPGCLGYHPVAQTKWHQGVSYISNKSELRPGEFIINANPLCHVIVTATHNGHEWDEQFPYWEGDMDYHLTMERSDRKACICRGSHVDHLEGSQFREGAPMPPEQVEARRRLEAKWNLPRIEYS